MKSKWKWLFCAGYLISSSVLAETKEIAITIDDLPFVGSANGKEGNLRRENERFMLILDALKERKVPATGFVIAGSIEKGQWSLLEMFKSAGFTVGNHTYTHKSLSGMSAEKYIADLEKADKILAPVMTEPKYFRYPYLAEGAGEKKQKVYDWLKNNHYTIAPVTIDSKDYTFNAQLFAIAYRNRPAALPSLKKRYLAYVWRQTEKAEARAKKDNVEPARQILLIHANLLNSHFLGDLIDMYQKNGYTIVTLDEAMKAPAPPLVLPETLEKAAEAGTKEVFNQEKLKKPGVAVAAP